MYLYANTPVRGPKARLNRKDPRRPFAEIPMGPGFDITARDPAELDAIAAEFTAAAAMLREALAEAAEPVLAGSAVTR